MTNLIKRKGLLFLMAVVVMVAMTSVACKNKVTASYNLYKEVGTEEVIGGIEMEEPTSGTGDTIDNKDAIYNKYVVDNKNTVYNEGIFYNKDFTVIVKNDQITIEYKDSFGGQGPLVIKAEGKTIIKAKNSKYGFNLIIDGKIFLATSATPNYDANGNLSDIAFDGYEGTKVVKFSK